MKIDEGAFSRMLLGRGYPENDDDPDKLRLIISAYLSALPSAEPGRDRIAVVVDGRDRSVTRRLRPNMDDEDMAEIWEQMEGQLSRVAAQFGETQSGFARAIVRCNLPRPAEPVEVEGSVEVVDHG